MTNAISDTKAHVLDQKAAAEVYAKVARGAAITPREQALLKRFEKQREEELRWKFYRSIPQKHWRQMSGRQTKVLNEQAQRYGLAVGGPTIDLTRLARQLHDFLAENAMKLAAPEGAPSSSSSPALEAFREERAALARLERLEREGQLLPRDDVRDALSRIAARLRSAGDALQRAFGNDAVDLLFEALDDAQADIDLFFATHHEPPRTTPSDPA